MVLLMSVSDGLFYSDDNNGDDDDNETTCLSPLLSPTAPTSASLHPVNQIIATAEGLKND